MSVLNSLKLSEVPEYFRMAVSILKQYLDAPYEANSQLRVNKYHLSRQLNCSICFHSGFQPFNFQASKLMTCLLEREFPEVAEYLSDFILRCHDQTNSFVAGHSLKAGCSIPNRQDPEKSPPEEFSPCEKNGLQCRSLQNVTTVVTWLYVVGANQIDIWNPHENSGIRISLFGLHNF